MHYFIITSEFPPGPGGIGKHAFCLAKALVHSGVEVTVVCNMDYATEDEIERFTAGLPNKMHIVHIKRQGAITYVKRLRTILELCKRVSFDKVIVSGQFSIWMGGLLKKLYRSKILVSAFVHGSELLLGGSFKKRLTYAALQNADVLWPVSTYTASLLNKIDTYKNVQIIPNGLDITEWNEPVTAHTWKGYPKLLTTGSVTMRKGQHNVINALPLLKKHYPEIHYHIVGLPIDKARIEALAKQLQVENHITVHGKITNDDLKRAYKSADIFCMLSEAHEGDVEGFGIAVLEANVNNIPAIGSKGTGIEDAIKDEVNGKLINAHVPDELLSAIQCILGKDKNELSTDCKNWALKHDWNEIVKQLL